MVGTLVKFDSFYDQLLLQHAAHQTWLDASPACIKRLRLEEEPHLPLFLCCSGRPCCSCRSRRWSAGCCQGRSLSHWGSAEITQKKNESRVRKVCNKWEISCITREVNDGLTPRKMSRSSTAYVAQMPPLRKRKKERKKGMNSTLLVVITVFCTSTTAMREIFYKETLKSIDWNAWHVTKLEYYTVVKKYSIIKT